MKIKNGAISEVLPIKKHIFDFEIFNQIQNDDSKTFTFYTPYYIYGRLF